MEGTWRRAEKFQAPRQLVAIGWSRGFMPSRFGRINLFDLSDKVFLLAPRKPPR